MHTYKWYHNKKIILKYDTYMHICIIQITKRKKEKKKEMGLYQNSELPKKGINYEEKKSQMTIIVSIDRSSRYLIQF